jgi:metalloendopeptidase OMA1, mitochondrial
MRQCEPKYSSQNGRTSGLKLFPLLAFAVFALFYYFSHQETVPGTGRKQVVALSRSEEQALGVDAYQKVLMSEPIIAHGPQVDRLRRIGLRLAAVVPDSNYDWEFNLIKSDQANAFALPGGKVAVYSGILDVAANDDGLAAILGHEIAHAVARHGAERMAPQTLAQMGGAAIAASVDEMSEGKRQMILAAFGLGSQFGVMLPFSREHESEADYLGLRYMALACFNPSEAPLLWERMSRVSKGRSAGPEFISTHPAPKTRIAQFQRWLPEAEALQRETCLPDRNQMLNR